jgi:hypothetical protein
MKVDKVQISLGQYEQHKTFFPIRVCYTPFFMVHLVHYILLLNTVLHVVDGTDCKVLHVEAKLSL